MENKKCLLIDIILEGRFVCQLRYTKHGIPQMINGEIKEVHNTDDINKFVLEQRPSLKGKNYQINFSNQRV